MLRRRRCSRNLCRHPQRPYVLDFLGLQHRCLERDLEDAILRKLELFLLELDAGFSFVARHKRIQLDGNDFFHEHRDKPDLSCKMQ